MEDCRTMAEDNSLARAAKVLIRRSFWSGLSDGMNAEDCCTVVGDN